MSETPGSDNCRSRVELMIDRVIAASSTQAAVTVRCLSGPVRRGTRFNRLSGAPEQIDLTLAQIVVYQRRVAELDTGLTALVTLQGEGVRHLKSGPVASRWQVIEGANPLP
ncbi:MULTISPECIES: hypothetical protein [unclassified Streptomyces]|uniref:hypothetical protein n=1 Tax=unclassified Streptomyces TaxID=2593676 RepID=UPI0036FADF6A